MANAIQAINGITLANLAALNGKTDANIQALNGLELTGSTPYLAGNPYSNHATLVGSDRTSIYESTTDGSGSGATYRDKSQKISAGATYTHTTINVTCDASVETYCCFYGSIPFRVAGAGNTQFVVTLEGSTLYDATTSASGNSHTIAGRANVTVADADLILTVENERVSDAIWIHNPAIGVANFRGDNAGDAPVCTGVAFLGSTVASPDDTLYSEGGIAEATYLITANATKTLIGYIYLPITPVEQTANAVTLAVGASWQMIEDSEGTGEIWFSYFDTYASQPSTRTKFYESQLSTTASTWDVNNASTSVVIPASYISNLVDTGYYVGRIGVELEVKHTGTGHWFNVGMVGLLGAEIASY